MFLNLNLTFKTTFSPQSAQYSQVEDSQPKINFKLRTITQNHEITLKSSNGMS